MAQAKRKTATKTAKKAAPKAKACAAKKTCCKKCGYKSLGGADKFHMCFILALALIAGILLAANAAIMMA